MAISFSVDIPDGMVAQHDVPIEFTIAKILRYANVMGAELIAIRGLIPYSDQTASFIGRSIFNTMHVYRFLTAYVRMKVITLQSWGESEPSIVENKYVPAIMLETDLHSIIAEISKYLERKAMGQSVGSSHILKAITQFNRDFCVFFDDEKNLPAAVKEDFLAIVEREGKLYAEEVFSRFKQ